MDYTWEYSEVNPVYPDKEKREAICKRCGAIWHPRKTDARRPTRCPYCHSHRTKWLDQHSELLDSKDDEVMAEVAEEVETEDDEWNNQDYSMEESMEDTGLSQDYAEDEESSDTDDTVDYTRINLGINPDYSTPKQKAKSIPKTTLYLVLGAVLIYGLIRI